MVSWGKITLAGIVVAIVQYLISNILTVVSGVSSLYAETVSLWKPMTGWWNYDIFVLNLIAGLLLVLVYTVVSPGLSYTGWKKGAWFGYLAWIAVGFSGMGMTYLTMNVPDGIVAVWALTGLIGYTLAGASIPLVLGELKHVHHVEHERHAGRRRRRR